VVAERLAEVLEVFADRVECRRAYPMLLDLVKTSTLLHQRQRKTDQDGRLIADPLEPPPVSTARGPPTDSGDLV
jgi:hypothetical protein